jgi:hypothetical protein
MASGLAAGKTQMDAYAAAGFTGKTVQSAGSVAQRPEVRARVAEIIATQHNREIRSNERAIEKASVTKEWGISRLKYIAEFGIRGRPLLDERGNDTGKYIIKPDLRSAENAVRTLMKMGGWLVQQHEIGAPGDFSRLSDLELQGELIEVGKRIGIPEKELQKALTGK